MTHEEINTIIIALITGGTASIVTALFAGRKTRAETRKLDSETAMNYQKLAAEMLEKYNELQREFTGYKKECVARLEALEKTVNGGTRKRHSTRTNE